MNRLPLAMRLLWRDGRSGELTILVLALVIAVTSSTAISLFADRLQATMNQQAADFMAADLVITSSSVLPRKWHDKADALSLKQANTIEFASVLIENDELLLSGLKAVSDNYPLRGHLKTTATLKRDETVVYSGPEKGTAWVDARVLTSLKLTVGEQLHVGELALRISRVLTYEPDKSGNIYSLSPRVMIHSADLPATGIVQPGSQVRYFFQFAGEAAKIKQYTAWVDDKLNPSQRLIDIHENRPEIGTALQRAERYLGLSSILVILIAGVAIAMAARRYTERHFDATAILRCLGCKQSEILFLYGLQVLMVGVLASLFGCLLGYMAQKVLFYLLASLMPPTIAAPSFSALALGFLTGMATLVGFALPPLLRLKHVSTLRVLRRELEPVSTSGWLVYGFAVSIIAVLIWHFTQDIKLSLIIIGVGSLVLLVLASLIYFALSLFKKVLPRLSLSWRFGLQELVRKPHASIGQILAFSITLMAMLLSFTVRNNLLADWQAQLPVNTPNHFALNVFPEQLPDFKKSLQHHNIPSGYFYPIVRGRLVAINDVAVQKIVSKDSQGERATHRDLSLTWSSTIPPDNKVLQGEWFAGEEQGLVSIESKLAKSLGVGMGDVMTYTVGSQQFTAKVSNIREVQWDTMKPNFYMIFSPGTMDQYPTTYLTSFYLPEDKKGVLNELVKAYPAITVFEVDIIIKQLETIVAQITKAIDYLLLFSLLAGVMVLLAAIYSTLDARIYSGALLRTLGANKQLLRKSQFIEFSLLGLTASVLALIVCEAISYSLYHFIFKVDYQTSLLTWILVPSLVGVMVGLTGLWGVRKVVSTSPVEVLRGL
jgi:putative ABC transport system permease protein